MSKLVIAGGGVAGMAAALAFAREGWEVSLYERREALSELGAGIQMSPNACHVLNWLGVLPQVGPQAVEPRAAVLRDGPTGRVVYRAALADQAEQRWGAPYIHIHRADLLDVLIEAAKEAGAHLHMGVSVERAVMQPDGVHVHLSDGSIVDADLALGADGINSALRRGLAPDEDPRFTGQVAWRTTVPAELVPAGTLPMEATVWAGSGRHLVSYYIRGGELINLVAVREQSEWAGEGWMEAGDPDDMRVAFADFAPEVQSVLQEVTECYLWGLFDRPEQVRWVDGRLAMIGDAAHPMLPFMAQGAAQALEDVAALVRHLRGNEIPAALAAWEDERWPRATRVLQTAEANGRMFHRSPGMKRTLSRGVISTVSRLAPGLAAGQLDWLYGFNAVKGP
ncbi:MAG: FAD-dependent monooxygenase [Pseudomonadota bacterium]